MSCTPSLPYPHVIRETCTVSWSYWRDHKAECKQMVKDTDARAFAMAKQLGIKRVSVRGRNYDLEYFCRFTDYPMYLLGPGVPQITSFKTAFAADYRDNPVARYQIVLDNQDHLDRLDKEWMDGLVTQARAKGLESLNPYWAPNVIARVRRALKGPRGAI